MEVKGFWWYSLRISFWSIIPLLFLGGIHFAILVSLFVIISSIVNLFKYQEKKFAIFALVISSLLIALLLFFIFMWVGLI